MNDILRQIEAANAKANAEFERRLSEIDSAIERFVIRRLAEIEQAAWNEWEHDLMYGDGSVPKPMGVIRA